jgi:hypothetical protein
MASTTVSLLRKDLAKTTAGPNFGHGVGGNAFLITKRIETTEQKEHSNLQSVGTVGYSKEKNGLIDYYFMSISMS